MGILPFQHPSFERQRAVPSESTPMSGLDKDEAVPLTLTAAVEVLDRVSIDCCFV